MKSGGITLAVTKWGCRKPPAKYRFIIAPLVLASTLGSTHVLASTEKEVEKTALKIAQVDWCPQICVDDERRGYIVDILEAAFKDSDFNLTYKTYSWSRGISHTKNGETVALLAAAAKETPTLLFPQRPIGEQQACFYTQPNSSWRYTGVRSIDDISIGLPQHISLEELNEYQREHPAQFHLQASTPRYIELSIAMLERGRLDTFVFFRNTMIHHLAEAGTPKRILNAGCVSATPVYMVFSPAEAVRELGEKARNHYDSKFEWLVSSGTIASTMANYGLPDWSHSFTIQTPD